MMKDRKYRLAAFCFYDHTHIEKMLERQAEKGWRLEKIGSFFLRFRRIEPAALHYTVSYCPRASAFDPEPDEEQQEFIDFCARTGWVLAAANAKLTVFYNENNTPTPIDTDPVLELQTLHRAALTGYLPAYGVLILLTLFRACLLASQYARDPIGTLSDPGALFAGFGLFILLLLCGGELLVYFLWRRRARRVAAYGEFLATLDMTWYQHVFFWIFMAVFILYLLSLLKSGEPLRRFVILLMLVYVTLLFLAVNGTKELLKRRGVDRETNRALTILVDIVLAVGLMVLVTGLAFHAERAGWFAKEQEDAQSAAVLSARGDSLLLTAAELYVSPADAYRTYITDSASPLLGAYTCFDIPDRAELPSLYWRVIDVRLPYLYDFCKRKLTEPEQKGRDEDRWLRVDAAPWGAEEAYLLADAYGTPRGSYLLCYARRFVRIAFYDSEPTPEQMALVEEKLGK